MASISINILPDNDLPKVVGHIAYALSYASTVNGQPNPETKVQFVKRYVAEHLKLLAKKGARMEAEKAAGDTAESTVSPISIS